MNNNNRGNNRRRGRNNNGRQQGGGQHLNRIDSRARGNAPQMLDKYKKLAEEAHRNGDRVQAEYYLQFADHYFRVIADGKSRQEEQQQQRVRRDDGDRYDDRYDDGDSDVQDNDNDAEQDVDAPQRGEQQRNEPRREEARRDDARSEQPRRERARRDEARRDDSRREDSNPFTRESRQRRQRREIAEDDAGAEETERAVHNDGGLDPQALPPAIGETEEKPKRRGRPRKVKAEDAADTDVPQAVNG